ncbi:hypothetical protein CFOL_v3_22711, partial [Cephalotus follicularis]
LKTGYAIKPSKKNVIPLSLLPYQALSLRNTLCLSPFSFIKPIVASLKKTGFQHTAAASLSKRRCYLCLSKKTQPQSASLFHPMTPIHLSSDFVNLRCRLPQRQEEELPINYYFKKFYFFFLNFCLLYVLVVLLLCKIENMSILFPFFSFIFFDSW